MERNGRTAANDYLAQLIGCPLRYGHKSQGCEFYDLGFGKEKTAQADQEHVSTVSQFALHVVCRFKVIWKIGDKQTKVYDEDTDTDVFSIDVKNLLGHCVQRVALSDKNDLWLDFGDFWIVFATFDDNDESWRFFLPYDPSPHFVASAFWLRFDYE